MREVDFSPEHCQVAVRRPIERWGAERTEGRTILRGSRPVAIFGVIDGLWAWAELSDDITVAELRAFLRSARRIADRYAELRSPLKIGDEKLHKLHLSLGFVEGQRIMIEGREYVICERTADVGTSQRSG